MKPNQLITIFTLPFLLLNCKKNNITNEEITKQINEDSAFIEQKKAVYQPFVDSLIKKHHLNGIIRIGWKDKLVYTNYSGYSNFKDSIKISENSNFAIASISKQFTAAIILQLEQKRQLHLDDKVASYLPDFDNRERKDITIRQLLNHTSGIVDHGTGIASKPGKTFSYSNKGFYILQQIIEKITGEKMSAYVQKLAAERNLNNTKAADQPTDSLFSFAYVGSRTKPEIITNMPKRLLEPNISLGAGGIISSAKDLQNWNYQLYTGQIVASKELKQFITKYSDRPHPILGTMGYGLGIMMNLKGPQSYFHSGYVKGAPSLNLYYPQSKLSVIILSNFANESLGKKAVFKPHLELKKFADSIESI